MEGLSPLLHWALGPRSRKQGRSGFRVSCPAPPAPPTPSTQPLLPCLLAALRAPDSERPVLRENSPVPAAAADLWRHPQHQRDCPRAPGTVTAAYLPTRRPEGCRARLGARRGDPGRKVA